MVLDHVSPIFTIHIIICHKGQTKSEIRWFCHVYGHTIIFKMIDDVTWTIFSYNQNPWLAAILDFNIYTEEYPLYNKSIY